MTADTPAGDAEVLGWQPWETVPRDDEPLLATDDRIDGGFPQVVFWDPQLQDGWRVPDAGIRYREGFFTHWRRDCLAIATTSDTAKLRERVAKLERERDEALAFIGRHFEIKAAGGGSDETQ